MKKSLQNENLSINVNSFGGALSSIKDKDGLEYLWQGDKKYWSGQAPVLFPICGSLRNDKAVIGGDKETTMPRHGIVRKREFELENSDLYIPCTFLLWDNLERPIFYEDRGK